jgi:hypothetical protein
MARCVHCGEVIESVVRYQLLVNVNVHNFAKKHVHEPASHQQILVFVPSIGGS